MTLDTAQPRHTMTMVMVMTSHHKNWNVSAEDAIRERVSRLRECKTPFVREGMTIRYTDRSGYEVTLSYEVAS